MKKTLLVLALLVVASLALATKVVQAGGGDNLSGWAWSSNIGWISFNSTNHGDNTGYGVRQEADGSLSGWAWSSNIGWVSFNPADLAGCPEGTCTARVTGNTMVGWARACAATPNGDCRNTPVIGPGPLTVSLNPVVLNSQTGLFESNVNITNNNAQPVTIGSGKKVYITAPLGTVPGCGTCYFGGADGVSGGIPYINIAPQVLSPGQTVRVNATSLGISWYLAGRNVNDVTSAFRANADAGTMQVTPADSGWTGWISLSHASDPVYGVTFNSASSSYRGFAWGGNVIGWIDFAPLFNGGSVCNPAVQVCGGGTGSIGVSTNIYAQSGVEQSNSINVTKPNSYTVTWSASGEPNRTCEVFKNGTLIPIGQVTGSYDSGTYSSGSTASVADGTVIQYAIGCRNNTLSPGDPSYYTSSSAVVTVHDDTPGLINVSCLPTRQVIRIGSSTTWNAVVTPPGTYTYSWTGTDGLTGNTASVPKTYTSAGVKTASVTVTSTTPPATATCNASLRVSTDPVIIQF